MFSFFPEGIGALFVKIQQFEVWEFEIPFIKHNSEIHGVSRNIKVFEACRKLLMSVSSRIMLGFFSEKNWTRLLLAYFTPVKFQNQRNKIGSRINF